MDPGSKTERVQIWTSNGGKEFALKKSSDLDGLFLTATHLGMEYPLMLEELEVADGTTCDWQGLLQKKANEWIAKGEQHWPTENIGQSVGHSSMHIQEFVAEKNKPKTKRVKPTLKCHFCYLLYLTELDRLEHEKMWHPMKLQARAG